MTASTFVPDPLRAASPPASAGATITAVLLAVLLAGLFTPAWAAPGEPALAWVRSDGGTGNAQGHAVAAAADGAVVAGDFWGFVTFGAGEANETALQWQGGNDVFVARYDNSGALAWVRRSAGGAASARDLAVDADGYVTITGEFSGTVKFGSGEVNETGLESGGSTDVFVARYAPDGTFLWARHAGGPAIATGLGVGVDAGGNVTVTGYFGFGALTFRDGGAGTTLASAGSWDVFVARYDASGTLEWTRRDGGGQAVQAHGVAVGADGTATITGNFASTATFGDGVDAVSLSATGGSNVFVARYDAQGQAQWASRAGGMSASGATAVAVDADGHATVTGRFLSTATFGPGEPNETTLEAVGVTFDAFVARYDSSGALAWARRDGGADATQAWAVAVDADGNAVVAGHLEGPATFGADEEHETTIGPEAGWHAFVAGYDAAGALRWVDSAGGSSTTQAFGVAVDDTGAPTVTGRFFGTATFGAEPDEVTVASGGGHDLFVARYALTQVSVDPPVFGDEPADLTVEATGPDGATVDYPTPSAYDAGDGSAVDVLCTPASGVTFPLGATTVECTATDSRDNTTTATFEITVVDTTPPELDVPAGIDVVATGADGATVTFEATAADLVDPTPTVACTPSSGTIFPVGVTTVACTATDAHDNTSIATFTVTVRGIDDLLAVLAAFVADKGAGNSLTASVRAAQRSLDRGNTAAACDQLQALGHKTAAQSGGRHLSTVDADTISTDIAHIRAALGCSGD